MIQVFDVEDASFLKDYEDYFMNVDTKAQSSSMRMLKNMPQYTIKDHDFINKFLSHYEKFFEGYTVYRDFNYVFRFEPNKPTMLPHLDIDVETAKYLKQYGLKRILIYVNPVWDYDKWKGGTYFAPFEQYEDKATRYNTCLVKKEKFAEESVHVKNVPGRMVWFDPEEWHMPEEFSGNPVQRLIFAAGLIPTENAYILDEVVVPTTECNEGHNGTVQLKKHD